MTASQGGTYPPDLTECRLGGYVFTYYPANGGVIVTTARRLTVVDVGVIGEPRTMTVDQLRQWARGWLDRSGRVHLAYGYVDHSGTHHDYGTEPPDADGE